jgi:hypothetical protein
MIIQNFHKIDGFIINTNNSNVKIDTFSQIHIGDKRPNKKQVRTYMGIANVFDATVHNGYSFPKERWDMHIIVPYYEGNVEKIKIVLKEQQSTNEIHQVADLSFIRTLNKFKYLLVQIFTKQY